MRQPPPGCRLATDGPFKGKYIVEDLDALMRSRFSHVMEGMLVGHCVWCESMMVTPRTFHHVKCSQCGERHRLDTLDGGGSIWRPDPEPRDVA